MRCLVQDYWLVHFGCKTWYLRSMPKFLGSAPTKSASIWIFSSYSSRRVFLNIIRKYFAVSKEWLCCAIVVKRKELFQISKASEGPSDYHPSCRLTSGSSLADNDELAQKECSRMMTTDIFLKISWWQAGNWRLTGSISAPWSRHGWQQLVDVALVQLGAMVCGYTRVW